MDTATTEIDTYRHTLSLHDALPICQILGAADTLLDELIATDRRNREADLVDRFSELAGGDDDLAGTQTFTLRRFGGCGLGSRLLRRSLALGECGRTEAKKRDARCV